MKRLIYLLIILCTVLIACSCQNNTRHTPQSQSVYIPLYAKGFKIFYYEDYKMIETENYRYYLSKNPKNIRLDTIVIQIPIKNMACMAQSHWAAAYLLNEAESITGICDGEYISDSIFQQYLKAGRIKNIAENQTVNYEALFSLSPQLLMLSFDDQKTKQVLQDIGIQTVINNDFYENHPLGRAEWLIFIAAFFDKDEEAKIFFNRSVQQYEKLCTFIKNEFIENNIPRPTIFDGSEASGVWYVSGGKSYMAQFYADAGSDYLWKDNGNSGSISVDFETIYYKGLSADFWRAYLPFTTSYTEIANEKPLYTHLKAWKERHIFYCDNLHTNLFGMGVYQPEIILADLIKIFHPQLIPNHEAVYYDFLKKEI